MKKLILMFVLFFLSASIVVAQAKKKSSGNSGKKTVRKTSMVDKRTVLTKYGLPKMSSQKMSIMAQSVNSEELVISSKTPVLVNVSCHDGQVIISHEMSPYPMVAESLEYKNGEFTKDSNDYEDHYFALALLSLDLEQLDVTPQSVTLTKASATTKTVTTALQIVQEKYGADYQVNTTIPHNCTNIVRTKKFVFGEDLHLLDGIREKFFILS